MSTVIHDSRPCGKECNEKKEPTKGKLFIGKDEKLYHTNTKKRKAFIFNHNYNIIERKTKHREGTEEDVTRLTMVLQKLNFEIEKFDDLTRNQIFSKLDELQNASYEDYDLIAVFVMTHGVNSMLMAQDKEYNQDELWTPFTADKCPSLAGKPKLFFINACRGLAYDPGHVFVHEGIETDALQQFTCKTYKIPVTSDFLIVFSTFHDYVSIRETGRGSVFIQCICDVLLDERNRGLEMYELLTKISHKVAMYSNSNTNISPQVPTIMSTLIRKLYL